MNLVIFNCFLCDVFNDLMLFLGNGLKGNFVFYDGIVCIYGIIFDGVEIDIMFIVVSNSGMSYVFSVSGIVDIDIGVLVI